MIILGLGTIKYAYLRHNIGHIFLNQLVEYYQYNWNNDVNYQFTYCNKNILIKPNQFLTDYNIIPELIANFDFSKHKLLVVHDDIFLPMGRVRLNINKNKSKYKSLQIINQYFNNFLELKFGIDCSNFYLKYINEEFTIEDYEKIIPKIHKCISILPLNQESFNNINLIKIQTIINSILF